MCWQGVACVLERYFLYIGEVFLVSWQGIIFPLCWHGTSCVLARHFLCAGKALLVCWQGTSCMLAGYLCAHKTLLVCWQGSSFVLVGYIFCVGKVLHVCWEGKMSCMLGRCFLPAGKTCGLAWYFCVLARYFCVLVVFLVCLQGTSVLVIPFLCADEVLFVYWQSTSCALARYLFVYVQVVCVPEHLNLVRFGVHSVAVTALGAMHTHSHSIQSLVIDNLRD